MIILPDKNECRTKILMPVPEKDWRTPSQFVYKDDFGNDVIRVKFRVRARIHDGFLVWEGWFESRDDFDAFLFSIANDTLKNEPGLWKLPNPQWHPDIGEVVTYDFAVLTYLTATSGTATYTSPKDWNNANNSVECIGGGGGGAAGNGTTTLHGCGGGGGAYSKITNFAFAAPGTTTATYSVGANSGVSVGSSTGVAGSAGKPTWFNNATNPGVGTNNTKCSGAAGSGGAIGTGSRSGGAGGPTTTSWGQTKFAGGAGGNLTGASGYGASGGGGAGGPSGAGGAGVSSSATTAAVQTNGGTADNGTVLGGATRTPSGGVVQGNNGANGTEFNSTHGCGGGGAGAASSVSTDTGLGGYGGNYGGGGGATVITGTGTASSGRGRQGLIVIQYNPPIYLSTLNLPMLGL